MRFSILQLLILVSFVAVASVSLKFAGLAWWTGLSIIGLLLYFALAIVALIGRAEPRAFAIGFIACCTLYGLLLHFFNVNGLSAHTQLPTARALEVVYSSIATESVPQNVVDSPMAMISMLLDSAKAPITPSNEKLASSTSR